MTESIADDTIGPLMLLEGGDSLGIALYPNVSEKVDLVARMSALAEPRKMIEVGSGQDALAFIRQPVLVIIDPQDEVATVSFFERNRDHFENVEGRFLLLLLRGGSGERALNETPALASFLREASFEIPLAPSREEAREMFKEQHGKSPEVWLMQWRGGELPDTQENNYILTDALSLEDEP